MPGLTRERGCVEKLPYIFAPAGAPCAVPRGPVLANIGGGAGLYCCVMFWPLFWIAPRPASSAPSVPTCCPVLSPLQAFPSPPLPSSPDSAPELTPGPTELAAPVAPPSSSCSCCGVSPAVPSPVAPSQIGRASCRERV